MNIEKRVRLWSFLLIAGAVLIYWGLHAESQLAFDQGDRSAFAWLAFLPFIIPLFLLQSAMVVVPLAACVEAGIWVRNRKKTGNLETSDGD